MNANVNYLVSGYAAMAAIDPEMAKQAMLKDGTYWIVVQRVHAAMASNNRNMELANNMANSPMLSIRS